MLISSTPFITLGASVGCPFPKISPIVSFASEIGLAVGLLFSAEIEVGLSGMEESQLSHPGIIIAKINGAKTKNLDSIRSSFYCKGSNYLRDSIILELLSQY